MFIVIVVMTGMFLFTAIAVGVMPLFDIFHSNNSQVMAREIATIQSAINEHAISDANYLYNEGYVFPRVGGKVDVNSDKNRHLYFMNYERYKYRKTKFNFTSVVSGTQVRSYRFAMWFESPFGNFLGDDYTKAVSNKCGEGAFEIAQEWCGDTKSLWAKLEAHTSHYGLIQSEEQRLYRLSRKFYRYYEETGDFEGLIRPLSSPAMGSLANTVNGGVQMTAGQCKGVYNLGVIPLDCQDMFNAWGKPIYLHVLNSKHIAFTNSLGIEIPQAAGAPRKYVGLAEEINIEHISF